MESEKRFKGYTHLDLFAPPTDPRTLAIDRTLKLAVEAIIEDDTDEAERLFDLGRKYVTAPNQLFERESV